MKSRDDAANSASMSAETGTTLDGGGRVGGVLDGGGREGGRGGVPGHSVLQSAAREARSSVSRREKGSAAATQGLAQQVHAAGGERAPAGHGHRSSLL